MKLLGWVILTTAAAATSIVEAQPVTRELNVPGGRVKVTISPLPTTVAPPGPTTMARVGVAASRDVLATAIARKLDDSGKVQVTSAARFATGDAMSFDTGTRSEFSQSLSTACARAKVDYALYGGAPQVTGGVTPTAFLLGFGRIKQSQTFEIRLYDCRTQQPVWDQSVAVEDSSGIWTNIFMGKISEGGEQSENAAAQMIVDKLIADIGFVAGPAPATVPAHQVRAEASATTIAATGTGSPPVTMVRLGHLYATATANSRVIRTLTVGTILYPTGAMQGVWEEVSDEEGEKGWVSIHLVAPTQQ